MLPILHDVRRFPKGAEMVQSAKSRSTYFARHAERPSFKAGAPPPPK